MRKIIIAPDSFKGSLSSVEVANAIEEAIKRVIPTCKTVKMSIADGGEGTMETMVNAFEGEKIKIIVHDPLMRPIEIEYGLIESGKTAILEMAAASGLTLLSKSEQNPFLTTTFGTGEIIKDALKRGCCSFLIGIGGSATNDAGTGMLKALGFSFLDKTGEEVDGTGKSLRTIYSIDESKVIPEVKEAQFTIACDVNNAFSGPSGAAYVFAPQKGANEKMTMKLDEGLDCFRLLIKKEKGVNLNTIPGTGAAGGLGGGFVAFLNAQLKPGIEMVLEAVDFDKHLKDADLVITGEGKLDKQTAMGKAASGILDAACKRNVPVIAIGGSVEDIKNLIERGFTSLFSIVLSPMSLEEAMQKENAKRNIIQIIEQITKTIKHFQKK
ncbi:MAG: glycerate kinase [Dysgonamonadaceae bacterium]|nr:glycerate kinase [Dysgonamonadaceae bacterium]